MKAFLLPLFLGATSAFAMPCDTGYMCTSASGKYKIEIQHCRYDNRLGNIALLKIDGKDATGTLSAAWDGDSVGAFEITLPQRGELEEILSVEFSKPGGKGTIRDKSRIYDPSPFKTKHSEAIRCVDEG